MAHRAHLEQGIDDRAFGNLIAGALRRHMRHGSLQTPQIGDFLTDVFQMFDGERVNLPAGVGVPID